MVKKWPGSTQAVSEIFQFLGIVSSKRTVGGLESYSGYVGTRRLELTVNPADENSLGVQFLLEKADERGGIGRGTVTDCHGTVLHNCLKFEMKIQDSGRKEVFVYAHGGEICFGDTWGIHAEIR